MSEISMDLIKSLRDETGVSVMQCKKALEEAQGDVEKARLILRKKSSEIAAKKGDRELAAGAISTYVHQTGAIGTIVELSCETDFVAQNPEFKALAQELAMHITAFAPKVVEVTQIGEEERTKMMSFAREEASAMGKPADVTEKIAEGKFADMTKDMVLLDQPFVLDNSITVQQRINTAVQKFGERIMVSRFSRFQVGE